MHEDVIAREGRLLVAADHGLYLVQCAYHLVQAVLAGIEVHECIIKLGFAGMVLQQALIDFDGGVHLVSHRIQGCKAVFVPIVRGVEPHCFDELLHGSIGVVLPDVAQGHVIVCGVIVRESFGDDGQTCHSGLGIAGIVVLDGVHKQRLCCVPDGGNPPLGPCGGRKKA